MGRHHARRVRLIDPIGHGSTGVVWRAWDTRERRYVAAKLVQRAVASSPVVLAHPHVLSAYAWLEDEDVRTELMPLVRGGTADRLLAEHGALPPAYAALMLDQLLAALAAIHAAGLVHRDVKPANLLLAPSGTARPHLRLADLGVASRLGHRPVVDAGTPGYVAPEVRPGTAPDPRHDLYAAGVATVELMTGRIPRHPRDLPRGPWHALLGALVDTDPAGRPATAEEARVWLQAAGLPDGSPWRARPHPPHVPDRLRRLTLLEMVRVQGARAAQ